MTNAIAPGKLPILALLATLGLAACRAPDTSSQTSGAEKPLEVASIIAGCKTLDDCNRQCTEKTPAACVSAGRLYEFGHSVPADPSHAFQLYEQACDWKYAGGCYNAAVLLEAGKGVEKDLSRARELYAQVCQLGSKTACGRTDTVADAKP
jgi:TPR repeat protein